MWIRTAGEKDLQAIRDLLVETWHDTYDHIYGVGEVDRITSRWHSVDALRARLATPGSEFVVADGGEQLLGVAFADLQDRQTVRLRQLYVRPQAQRGGVGAALLDEIESCFPEARTVRLEVEGANHRALEFYRAKGFREVGTTANCGDPSSGIAALVLEKTLG